MSSDPLTSPPSSLPSSSAASPKPLTRTIRDLLIHDFGPTGNIFPLHVTSEWLENISSNTLLVYLHQMLVLAAQLHKTGRADFNDPVTEWICYYSPHDLIETYFHLVQHKARQLVSFPSDSENS
ncbi:MAG: hypothetical protein UX57_C0022G0020 [Candidatus Uhrbacteria bacterium GW2011_GWE2_46_68]|uniref:Uncharacterized protein n=1 Tax=Candidatus Uhrbacteria bacterium GW2011_GWE2_46_68 TaxID=1618994 RepID=A0A0G1Q5A3_9BACT|nr:MAG: hypothetical protein UX57_C0022G0020 [Candidatus Uhrbacteria bacterium GW2011_GWE2_46_68]